jgi:lipopolysaccharide/colanic/teichoic acid biosynthesis glycosyltransferase
MSALAKRCLDILLAAGAILLLLPLLAALAAAVRASSPGPMLFRQVRVGRFGEPYKILKFRSMYVGAPDLRNRDGSTMALADDARVTKVGLFLRQTSLDELPQLWNVLRGDMSLVGPRPDLPDQIRYYSAHDHRKLQMRPGITGLAQISGRNSIPWELRRRLDCTYVEQWSLWSDIKILFRTVPYVILRRDIHTASPTDEFIVNR